jgi:hypothetical protein
MARVVSIPQSEFFAFKPVRLRGAMIHIDVSIPQSEFFAFKPAAGARARRRGAGRKEKRQKQRAGAKPRQPPTPANAPPTVVIASPFSMREAVVVAMVVVQQA